VESSSARGVSERVNKNAGLPFHLASAADQPLRASPVSRVLRQRDKCAQLVFRHVDDEFNHEGPSVSRRFMDNGRKRYGNYFQQAALCSFRWATPSPDKGRDGNYLQCARLVAAERND
jgi:hypothetical protein